MIEKGLIYPDVVLSDCYIANIEVIKGEIILNFSELGIFKKDIKKNNYYRTKGAQVIIKGCDFDAISIKEIRTQKLSEDLYYESMYDIDAKIFFDNINSGKWKMEIVEEFHSMQKGFYTVRIRTEQDAFWCHIKLYYKNLIYSWGDIRYDYPW